MTREELIRSFRNVSARCKQQCPYQKVCHYGDFCPMAEAALVMSADATRIAALEEKINVLKTELEEQANTNQKVRDAMQREIDILDAQCYDYYDMIKAYNGGVEKQLYISPKRKYAKERLRRTLRDKKLKKTKDLTELDGDPRYAKTTPKPKQPEEVVI